MYALLTINYRPISPYSKILPLSCFFITW
jgi:hypothetical protein